MAVCELGCNLETWRYNEGYPMDRLTAVVLAAGEGKRMRSRQPKVLHPLCGAPPISCPLRAARSLADRIVLVVGPNADDVVAVAGSDVRTVVQGARLGSGHAHADVRADRGLADRMVRVVGPNADDVVAAAGSDVRTVVQAERLGSGHAVPQARREGAGGPLLGLPRDLPLLSAREAPDGQDPVSPGRHAAPVGRDDRAARHPPSEEPRGGDRADRGRGRAAGLRARAPPGGAREAHTRRPPREGR